MSTNADIQEKEVNKGDELVISSDPTHVSVFVDLTSQELMQML